MATQGFLSLELRVQFCLLVCCTYPSLSTVNKEKNQTDQSASLRVDTRETQQNRFAASCRDFGLTISTRKTDVMFQPAPQQPYSEPRIIVDGETLNAVDDLSYLGSTVSTAVNINSEVDKRIAKASSTFERRRALVGYRRDIKLKTKLKVYKAAVLPTPLYACETWTVY